MLSTLASLGTKLIGGLLGKSAEDKERKTQLAFAQNALQWKVQDAEKAGIHPLFAIGAPTATYQPISTGSLGNAVADMGQDLGRAADAVRDPRQRVDAYTAKLQALQLERGSLENELLRYQILNEARPPGHPPALPGGASIPGQGSSRDLRVGNLRISPKPYESQAQDWENEYGEWPSEFIGALRAVRDADAPVTKAAKDYIRAQVGAMLRGEPNDLLRLKPVVRARRNVGYPRFGGVR